MKKIVVLITLICILYSLNAQTVEKLKIIDSNRFELFLSAKGYNGNAVYLNNRYVGDIENGKFRDYFKNGTYILKVSSKNFFTEDMRYYTKKIDLNDDITVQIKSNTYEKGKYTNKFGTPRIYRGNKIRIKYMDKKNDIKERVFTVLDIFYQKKTFKPNIRRVTIKDEYTKEVKTIESRSDGHQYDRVFFRLDDEAFIGFEACHHSGQWVYNYSWHILGLNIES